MNDIIFTGLPREPQMFVNSLIGFSTLRTQGLVDKIILSTWENYIEPSYRDILDRYNVVVLEKTEPEDKGSGGNFFCQAKSLENGLEICDKSHYILKLRTDTWLDAGFIADIMRDAETYLAKEPGIFIKKVWVPYAEITKPFYMPDELFYGYHPDIAKLLNYDKTYETMTAKDGGGETHIRRFVDPFIIQYPIFRDMIKQISDDNFVKLFAPERFTLLNQRLEEEKYLKYLATYYHILYENFRIKNKHGVMKWYQPYCSPEIHLDNNKFRENFNSSKSFLGQRIFCYDDTWISNVVEGKLNHDKYAEKVYNIIKRIV